MASKKEEESCGEIGYRVDKKPRIKKELLRQGVLTKGHMVLF